MFKIPVYDLNEMKKTTNKAVIKIYLKVYPEILDSDLDLFKNNLIPKWKNILGTDWID